jgi:hypothetical protein
MTQVAEHLPGKHEALSSKTFTLVPVSLFLLASVAFKVSALVSLH